MKTVLLSCFLFIFTAIHGMATDLICCGGEEVFIIDPTQPNCKKWSWTAVDSPSIPEAFHKKFRSTDECKPYADGTILITSSSAGVALIEKKTKKCLFLAESKNAHSACLLPEGQVAIAASFGGDAMEFYDLKSRKLDQSIPLIGGHGSVWDASRECLWALGQVDLLKLIKSNGKWEIEKQWKLPTRGGHDLSPRYANLDELFLTSNSQVLIFNMASETFRLDNDIGEEAIVKSVDQHPVTRQIVYHQGSKGKWWSDTIRFVGKESIQLEGERLYKVRWDVPMERP